MHGDWTLVGPFRRALTGRATLAETTYPRRPEWRLDDYAHSIEQAALAHGISRLWLLAESFSSQVAWTMIRRTQDETSPLQIQRMILAGGFVRHPWPWGVSLAHRASRAIPSWLLKRLCMVYGKLACRRCGPDAEIAAETTEFVKRRTEPEDRRTLTSRYRLIANADLRPVARRTRLPVFLMSGALDPIVPWWLVRPWLQRNCPGFRDSHIIPRTGHNHLLDAPQASAARILEWISSAPG